MIHYVIVLVMGYTSFMVNKPKLTSPTAERSQPDSNKVLTARMVNFLSISGILDKTEHDNNSKQNKSV